MKEAGNKILTPLVSLDTPGKATVHVVILADPVSSPYIKNLNTSDLEQFCLVIVKYLKKYILL